MKNRVKFFFNLIFILILFLININVLAQEYTVYNGPSNLKAEVKNKGVYTYIEKRERLEPGIFENVATNSAESDNNIIAEELNFKYLNYHNWNFWVLFVILFLIITILIRLFVKLSKINKEIKRHKDYFKALKDKQYQKILEEDEIIYSESDLE